MKAENNFKTIIKLPIITILLVLFLNIFTTNAAIAANDNSNVEKIETVKYLDNKERNNVEKMLKVRLKLTDNQIAHLKDMKSKNRKEIDTVIKKMQIKHDEIRNIYLLGLPKFQTDIRTAPLKAELVMLNNTARTLKENHRKNFENILTPEQKIEFEKIKKELVDKRQSNNHYTFK